MSFSRFLLILCFIFSFTASASPAQVPNKNELGAPLMIPSDEALDFARDIVVEPLRQKMIELIETSVKVDSAKERLYDQQVAEIRTVLSEKQGDLESIYDALPVISEEQLPSALAHFSGEFERKMEAYYEVVGAIHEKSGPMTSEDRLAVLRALIQAGEVIEKAVLQSYKIKTVVGSNLKAKRTAFLKYYGMRIGMPTLGAGIMASTRYDDGLASMAIKFTVFLPWAILISHPTFPVTKAYVGRKNPPYMDEDEKRLNALIETELEKWAERLKISDGDVQGFMKQVGVLENHYACEKLLK